MNINSYKVQMLLEKMDVVVESLTLLLCIQEVLGWKFGLDTGYPD
jgi:hypothetical protein